jgi:hypothetical protein
MRKCNEVYQLAKDADKACRSSELSVDLIIIIVFLQTYS